MSLEVDMGKWRNIFGKREWSFEKEYLIKIDYLHSYISTLLNGGSGQMDTETDDCEKWFWNGVFCFEHKKFQEMKYWFTLAIERGHPIAMNNMGRFLCSIGKFDRMKEFYMMAIDEGNLNAFYNYGAWVSSIYGPIDNERQERLDDERRERQQQTIEWHDLAAKGGHIAAAINLANIFLEQSNLALVEKYSWMAFKMRNNSYHTHDMTDVVRFLGKLLMNTRNKEKLRELFLESIDLMTPHSGCEHFHVAFDVSNIDLFEWMSSIENPSEAISHRLQQLGKTQEVQIFKRQKAVFENLNNYKKCLLCLEDNVLHMMRRCGHEMCVNCYTSSLDKCIFNFCKIK